jgi:phosphoserine phosphatase
MTGLAPHWLVSRNWIVVDLDGTLANSSHRDHFAQSGDWDAFHGALGYDTPSPDVASVVNALHEQDYDILIVTGRPETYRRATMDWFAAHHLPVGTDLLMRPAEDWRSDTEVKVDLLAGFFGGLDEAHKNVLTILEDRDKMVERWRSAGFRCWQVQPGGY